MPLGLIIWLILITLIMIINGGSALVIMLAVVLGVPTLIFVIWALIQIYGDPIPSDESNETLEIPPKLDYDMEKEIDRWEKEHQRKHPSRNNWKIE